MAEFLRNDYGIFKDVSEEEGVKFPHGDPVLVMHN